MILTFTNECNEVEVFDTDEQANRWLEAIDVEGNEYTFLDDRGHELKASFGPPIRKRWLGFLPWTHEDYGPFSFLVTNNRRDDLLQKLRFGVIKIKRTQSTVRTLQDIVQRAPDLFNDDKA